MPDDREPRDRLAEARKAIERDAGQLRNQWGRAREEAVEGLGRITWISQIGSLLFRLRGWGRGPGKPDQ